MGLSVSVVVPTCGRPRLLERCLDALLAQTLDPGAFEVIVVDDGASGETLAVVREVAGRAGALSVRCLTTSGREGPAAARNRGWRTAAGRIIAFTDDDCVPEPDWLERGLAVFAEDVAGAMGRIIVPRGNKPTDYELNSSFLEFSEFATANCFYRRSVLEEVGGFDERFTRAWREDADLYFTLLTRGCTLIAAPRAIVVHPVRPGHWGISIREQSKTVFNALLYKKHPELYRRKIRNPLLFRYYAIVGSGLAFLAASILGLREPAAAGLFLWTAFTASVIRDRLRNTSRSPVHVLEMAVTSVFIPFLSVYWRMAGAVRFRVFFY